MKNLHGHIANVGAVALSSAVPPPSLNNLYIKTEMRLADGGSFAVVEVYSYGNL